VIRLLLLYLLLHAGSLAAAPFAYITNVSSNSVSVIDTASNAVVATVPVTGNPRGIAVNPAGTRAYTTNLTANTVAVINTATNTVVATVPVGTNPCSVALKPDGTRAYVANYGANNVSVIDTASNTVIATVAVGSGQCPIWCGGQPGRHTRLCHEPLFQHRVRD
jgi:YVTN family beta-propeller protein